MNVRHRVIAALSDFVSEHSAPNSVTTKELADFHSSLTPEQIRGVGCRNARNGAVLVLSGGEVATYDAGRWCVDAPTRPRPRKQCKKCPWKVGTNPHEIPNGYCERKHADLERTIAKPGALPSNTLSMMACHETPIERPLPCVGWLVHQLGPGNNIALRLAVSRGRVDANVETIGPQHQNLQDTLPSNINT